MRLARCALPMLCSMLHMPVLFGLCIVHMCVCAHMCLRTSIYNYHSELKRNKKNVPRSQVNRPPSHCLGMVMSGTGGSEKTPPRPYVCEKLQQAAWPHDFV